MATQRIKLHTLCLLLLLLLFFTSQISGQPDPASNSPTCSPNAVKGPCHDKAKSLRLKIIAIFSILGASMVGIGLPMFSTINPDRNLFILTKALASGVILATGFVHLLPDSWENLTSDCLQEKPWLDFPFTALLTAVAAIGTMMMDTIATAHYRRNGVSKVGCHVHGHHDGNGGVAVEVEEGGGLGGSERGAGGLSHQGEEDRRESKETLLLRYRVVAQVLELGIVVHSVIIGLSMGVSSNICTIRPLITAMCFHQLLEGIGLGGCILQAEYGIKMKLIMATFFSTTTPFGIALGIGLMNVYRENSPTSLIVVGILNAISAGLLVYMALVDLLASDFMGPKLQCSIKLQLWAYLAVFVGLGAMSIMAKWA